MTIKNEMEFLVRKEVGRQRERGPQGVEACWCSQCEADIVALALNQLPPRYCQEQNYGYGSGPGVGEKVRAVVTRAVEKVSRRPKHRPGRPDWRTTDPAVHNWAQKIGADLVGALISQRPGACACEQCSADALAYALNRYPPKYGVSAPGRESYQAQFEDFIRHEMTQVLTQATRVVELRPHH